MKRTFGGVLLLAICSGLVASLTLLAADQTPLARPPQQFPSGRECAARMTVPPGFEVKLFAGEPDVVNPIGIDFDHKGRVYVLECLQYPRKAGPGEKGADRIRV